MSDDLKDSMARLALVVETAAEVAELRAHVLDVVRQVADVVAERDELRNERDHLRLAVVAIFLMLRAPAHADTIAEIGDIDADDVTVLVSEVVAERDRLAMSLEEEQELHGEARAERDRLRAVVEVARDLSRVLDLEWTPLVVALEALDAGDDVREAIERVMAGPDGREEGGGGQHPAPPAGRDAGSTPADAMTSPRPVADPAESATRTVAADGSGVKADE